MNAVLKALPEQLQKNVMRSAGRAGAKIIRNQAMVQLTMHMRSRPPRPEDVLLVQRRTPRDSVQAVFEVGPPKSNPGLRLLSDGAEPHVIEGALLADRREGEVYGTRVSHPGQRGTQWLRKGYFGSKDRAIRAMAQAVSKALPRQVRKLVSQKYRSDQLRRIRRNVGRL